MLRMLVRLVEKLLKMKSHGDAPRADMYLPDFLLAFGIVLLGIGIGFAVGFVVTWQLWMLGVFLGGVLFGIAAVLCWKNQTIQVLSDNHFQYTTFLGNTYEYRFSDITDLRVNNDSMTLFVGEKKIHMESMAILSERLVSRINAALDQKA